MFQYEIMTVCENDMLFWDSYLSGCFISFINLNNCLLNAISFVRIKQGAEF
jgi:hypothetical protein